MGEATYDFTDDEQRHGKKEENFLDYFTMGFGEFGSVFVIVFISCMGCTTDLSDEVIPSLQKCIAGGLSVTAAIQMFGHISGAHANPAVTLSVYLMNLMSLKKACLYWICQVFGGITGYAVLLYVSPKTAVSSQLHCATMPSPDITIAQAFFVEVVITFILVTAINAAFDERCSKQLDSFPLRIGLIVTACALAAGPYTGASMNPARSLGPAIWQKNYTSLHIYILAPLLGGALSGLLYRHIILKTPE
ncbi:hypothetical protein WA026_000617 [Henosepilachna vigintioctopunctata]|uniref:Aquaporin n=1 Tax=Henosepilachna vigintioctopunctata TaxID=420089 RepID=A0AAW1V6N2_9CUCU|nr:aquaporin An.G [Henosepilachna vigintioctomaculata]